MKLTIVVDANPLISALLGGVSRKVLFDRRFVFVTTRFTLAEVEKYLPYIAEKLGFPPGPLTAAFSLLPLRAFERADYAERIPEARELIGEIDPKDVEILALALQLQAPLWSEDRHFEKVAGLKLLKTRELL